MLALAGMVRARAAVLRAKSGSSHMRFDTKVVRGAISPDPTTGAIVPPIYQTATYVLEEVGRTKGYDYTRSSNPTRATLEGALASVEGAAHAAAFASGMSAVDAVLRTLGAGREGFICSSCHNVQAGTPLENILAMVETVQQS